MYDKETYCNYTYTGIIPVHVAPVINFAVIHFFYKYKAFHATVHIQLSVIRHIYLIKFVSSILHTHVR